MSMKTKSKEAVDITPRAQNNDWKIKHTTDHLKDLLKNNHRLSFIINGMKIIVMPKKNNSAHLVFVNGIEQYSLRMNESEDYKKWFVDIKEKTQKEIDLQNDWRYLLSLNWPETAPLNVLWEYLEVALVCSNNETLYEPFPGIKVQARTLYEAEHYGRIIQSVRNNENKAENSIKEVYKKSKLQKRRKLLEKKKQKRLKAKQLHIQNCKTHALKQSEFRLVCVKHIPTNEVQRMPKRDAEKLSQRENGHYQIVPKYEWKRQLKKERENKPFNDGLQIIVGSSFPYEKSVYTGVRRKDRRFNNRGRTHNPLVKKVFIPTVCEKDKEENTIMEERVYNSFETELKWEEVVVNFYKYEKDPITGKRTKKTSEIWGTTTVWKKVGYEKKDVVLKINKPLVKHEKRTIHILTKTNFKKADIESDNIKLEEGEVLLGPKRKPSYKILENGMILYQNKKYNEVGITKKVI